MTQTPTPPSGTHTPSNGAPGSGFSGLSRRGFLRGSAALGGASMFSSLLAIQHFAEVAAAQDGAEDFKALVCVFLTGGNDGYNMLIPTAAAEYNSYAEARGSLALQSAAQHAAIAADPDSGAPDTRRGPYLPLTLDPASPNTVDSNDDPRSFALARRMPEVRSLFEAGNLAFVANVGTLSEPVTKAEYLAAVDGSGTKQVPNALFSHSDQQRQWRNGEPNRSVPDGWAGRFPKALSDANVTSLPMFFSLAGNNSWQANDDRGTYVIGRGGSQSYLGQGSGNNPDAAPTTIEGARYEALVGGPTVPAGQALIGASYTNKLKQHYADKALQAVAFHDEFSQHYDVSPFAQFDEDDKVTLEHQLAAVTATIEASADLGMKRQVFYVRLGGFDTHQNLLRDQPPLLDELSSALQKFWDDIASIGATDDVVAFTASEFGRTLKRNGQGTDHGWASHHMVMGGPVNGAKIYGSYPEDLSVNGPADVETNGRILPTTSVDAYGSELARWFGVPESDLPTVFPNAGRFFDVAAEPNPVGFLAAAQPPDPLDDAVEVFQSCFGTPSRGRFDVQVTNNSTESVDYSVTLTGLSPRPLSIAAGATGVVVFTARRDGEYMVEVTRAAEDAPFFRTPAMTVDCFRPVPFELVTSCLANRGRIDLWIENTTDIDASFETTYSHAQFGPIVKTRTIAAGETGRTTVTGRQYGTWDVRVINLSTDDVVYTGRTDVLCGAPQAEAVVRNSCITTGVAGAKGRVDFDLWNDSSITRHYQARFTRVGRPGSTIERTATLAPDGRQTLTITGRPNSGHQAEVWELDAPGGIQIRAIINATINISC